MRAEAKLPGRKWPWVALAIVVLAAIVVAVVVLGPQLGSGPAPTPAPTGDALPSTDPTDEGDPVPTGCLGGGDRDAGMVLAAQQAAPHTSNGAVEVAAALFRFAVQAPVPSADDANEVSDEVVSTSATPGVRDIAGMFASTPNMSGGMIPDGESFYISTVPGVWHLESSAADEVTVSLAAGYVVDGALSPSARVATTYTLTWEDGGWRLLKGAIKRTTEEMYSIGIPFTGGC